MRFEGEVKPIQLKGIQRAGADTICEDGAMNEVIGLEYKDGSFVPYCPDKSQRNVPSGTIKLHVHKTTFQTNVIAITSDSELFFKSETNFNSNSGTWAKIGDGVSSIAFVGNILCTDKLDYFYYSEEKGKYSNYAYKPNGDEMSLPNVLLRVTARSGEKMSESVYNTSGEIICAKGTEYKLEDGITTSSMLESRKVEHAKGAAVKAMDFAQRKGRLYGYVLAVYAYELMNGEMIHVSAPILLGRPCALNNDYDFTYTYINGNFVKRVNTSGVSQWFLPRYGHRRVNVVGTDWSPQAPVYEDEDAAGEEYATVAKFDKNGSFQGEVTDIIGTMPSMWGWYQNSYTYCVKETGGDRYAYPVFCIQSNSLQYKLQSDIDEKYNGQIKSLCIFLSKQISPYKDIEDSDSIVLSDRVILQYGSSTSYAHLATTNNFYLNYKSKDKLLEDISEANDFYLVKRIPFSEIKTDVDNDGWVTLDLEGRLGDALYTRERLKTSAFSRRENLYGNLSTYNGRLILYNYRQRLFSGYNAKDFQLNGGIGQYNKPPMQQQYNVKAVVEISPSSGEDGSIVVCHSRLSGTFINPYISYPDGNAKKITFYLYRVAQFGEVVPYYKSVFELQDTGKGFSYYCGSGYYINLADGEVVSETTETSSNTERDYPNAMMATGTYDPSYFMPSTSNKMGSGKILHIARLSISLSQDTFGRYPLLIFCTDGIYSLGVDTTGNGAFGSSVPFGREVCVNKNTICELDGAVLFASDKGLMIASENGVQEFAGLINGKPSNLPKSDMTMGNGMKLYRDIINNSATVQMTNAVSSQDFIEYISDSDTVVSYVSNKNKVIVYNKTYRYSYWIDIPTRTCTKLDVRIAFDNDNYPTEKYYIVNGTNATEYIMNYLSSDGPVDCMLQTRPIKLDQGFKSSMRCILRGSYRSHPSVGGKYAEYIVLGSLDAEHWQLIGIKEQKLYVDSTSDIGCTTERVSYKYLMVVFAGKLSPNSHIDHLEISVKNKYNNKLK